VLSVFIFNAESEPWWKAMKSVYEYLQKQLKNISNIVRYEIFPVAVNIHIAVFCVMIPCRLVSGYHFKEDQGTTFIRNDSVQIPEYTVS
jgi:hypothetical protein